MKARARRRAPARLGAAAALLLATWPLRSLAHAVGERYDLPLPLPYFVLGAALTVGLSFVVIAAVARSGAGPLAPGGASPAFTIRLPGAALLRRALQLLGLTALLAALLAGYAGEQHPARNLAPTLVWILGWVGLSLFVASVGNVWPALDPWCTLYDLGRGLMRRLRAGGKAPGVAAVPRLPRPPSSPALAPLHPLPPLRYPAALGAWPAVAFLLLCTWVEVIAPNSSAPLNLALWLTSWTAITLGGMALFGREAWQANADFVHLYFGWLGSFAPLAAVRPARLQWRWPGAGLYEAHVATPSMVALVLAMLATVLFDGLVGTQAWRLLERTLATMPSVAGLLDRDGIVLGSWGLITTWLVLLGAYGLACRIAARLAATLHSRKVAQLFAPSLVPIAVGYQVAHNFAYLLEQGRTAWALISDPLGRGWNLFGTAGYQPELGLVGARTTWFVALVAIVIGHVVSIWIAHRVALAAFATRRTAVLAGVVLTVLMVGYTALSLTIIADPLTRFSRPDPSYSAAPARKA